MDAITLYGLIAVSAMFVFYWLEERNAVFVMAFAVACFASSAYGFLSGAWPFGIVEIAWGAVALDRFRQRWRLRS